MNYPNNPTGAQATPKFYKEVFVRNASGEMINNLENLSSLEYKQYNKDVSTLIYNPELLKIIWNYRFNLVKGSNLDEFTKQKMISEIIQYIFVYLKEIGLVNISKQGESSIKPDYDLDENWAVKANTTIAKIKMDLEELYRKELLPNTLFATETNDGIGLLLSGFKDNHYTEIDTNIILNQIGIRINSLPLSFLIKT